MIGRTQRPPNTATAAFFAVIVTLLPTASRGSGRGREGSGGDTGTALAATGPAAPAAVHVRVRSATRIEARAARASGRLVVSGTVTDDAGRPVTASGGASNERVTLAFDLAPDPHAPTVPQPQPRAAGGGVVNVSTAVPEACAPAGGGPAGVLPPTLLGPDRLGVAVDAAGRFCVKLTLAPGRYVAHLEWPSQAPPSSFLEESRLDWPLDLTLPPVSIVSLAFDPARSVLSLDDGATDLEIIASAEEDGVTRGVPGLPVTLSNESGEALGDATTVGSGRAKFRVDPAHLGRLGKGELRATFAGSSAAGASTCSLAIERQSHIDLSLPDATIDGSALRLPRGTPEDGIAVRVTAAPRCARAGCTGWPTGTVEARMGDAVVGAATLEGGSARLLVTFARPAAPEVSLRIRYLPDAPWLLAGEELVVTQSLQGPSPWRRLPLGLLGLAVLGWLATARLSSWRPATRTGARQPKTAGRHVVARVELVEAVPGREGWTGQVVDAHDGIPVGGARVAIERRGFERVEVVAESRSGEDGRFALAPAAPEPGDEIVSEGALHAPLRGALPPCGDLRVALVLRRRAVLDRLVTWARRKGKPFDVRPEPTPLHVRRAAGAGSPVGEWADAVERAAYGGDPVDARAQAELDRLAPAAADAPERADPASRPRAR